MTKITRVGNLKIDYDKVSSAEFPVSTHKLGTSKQNVENADSVDKDCTIAEDSETDRQSFNDDSDSDFIAKKTPETFTQAKLDDLVRGLGLPKD